jgi:hypothetical protein
MSDSIVKRAWIKSVLGLQIGDAAEDEADEEEEDEELAEPFAETRFQKRWAGATNAWRDAIETVDDQINQVRAAMLRSGNPVLLAIADGGLMELTGNFKTPVMRSIFEIGQTSGEDRRKAATRALAAYGAFRNHVDRDDRIGALDDNASSLFGITVTIRDEIGGGLDRLTDAIGYLLKTH